jgi:hypothetical protein
VFLACVAVDLAGRVRRALGANTADLSRFDQIPDTTQLPPGQDAHLCSPTTNNKNEQNVDDDDGFTIQGIACERARTAMSETISPLNDLIPEKTKPIQQPNESQLSEKPHVIPDGDPTSVDSSEGGGPGLKCYLVRRS